MMDDINYIQDDLTARLEMEEMARSIRSSSKTKVRKMVTEWAIHPLKDCLTLKTGFEILSDIFKICSEDVKTSSPVEWYLSLYPNGLEATYVPGCIAIGLKSVGTRLYDDGKSQVANEDIEMSFCVLNIFNEPVETTRYVKRYNKGEMISPFAYLALISHKDLKDKEDILVKEDTLVIRFEVSCNSTPMNHHQHQPPSASFEKLYNDKFMTDVTICSPDKELVAHKAILAARSPVFHAMFTQDMVENRENLVQVPDISGEVMSFVLQFIYTGSVARLEIISVVEQLVPAADKYALTGLLEICEDVLQCTLSVDNVSQRLILADMHNMRNLKAEALKFAARNGEAVCETEGWSNLEKNHLPLVAEAFRAMAKIKSPEPARKRARMFYD